MDIDYTDIHWLLVLGLVGYGHQRRFPCGIAVMVSLDNPELLTKCDVVVTVILKHAWSLLYLNNHHIYAKHNLHI